MGHTGLVLTSRWYQSALYQTSLLWTRPVFSRPNRSGPDQTVLKPDGVWSRVHRCDQRGLVWLKCFIFQAKLESEREMFFTLLCFLVVFSFQMNPKQFKQNLLKFKWTLWDSDETCDISENPMRFRRTPWDFKWTPWDFKRAPWDSGETCEIWAEISLCIKLNSTVYKSEKNCSGI